MSGSIGVPMGGSSRRAAFRRNLQDIIKARDILTTEERGLAAVDQAAVEVCHVAVTDPSLLPPGQWRMIYAVWTRLAESGVLCGIRNKPRK